MESSLQEVMAVKAAPKSCCQSMTKAPLSPSLAQQPATQPSSAHGQASSYQGIVTSNEPTVATKISLPIPSPVVPNTPLPQQTRLYMEGCTCLVGIFGCIPCFLGLGLGYAANGSLLSPNVTAQLGNALLLAQAGIGAWLLRQSWTVLQQVQAISTQASFGKHVAQAQIYAANRLRHRFPKEQSALQTIQIAAQAKVEVFNWALREQQFRGIIGGAIQGLLATQVVWQSWQQLGTKAIAHGTCHQTWAPWTYAAYCGLLGVRHSYFFWRDQRINKKLKRHAENLPTIDYRGQQQVQQRHQRQHGLASLAWFSSSALHLVDAISYQSRAPAWLHTLSQSWQTGSFAWLTTGIHVGAMVLGAQRSVQHHTPLPSLLDWTRLQCPSTLNRVESIIKQAEQFHSEQLQQIWQFQPFKDRIVAQTYESYTSPMCGPTSSLALATSMAKRPLVSMSEQYLLLDLLEQNLAMQYNVLNEQGSSKPIDIESSLGKTLLEEEQVRNATLDCIKHCQVALANHPIKENVSLRHPTWLTILVNYVHTQGSLGELLSSILSPTDPIFQKFAPQPYPVPTLHIPSQAIDTILSLPIASQDRFFVQLLRNVLTPFAHQAKREMVQLTLLPALLETNAFATQPIPTQITCQPCCKPKSA